MFSHLNGASSPTLAKVLSGYDYLQATQPVAPWAPFSLFGILHAARLAAAYHGGARKAGFHDRIGYLQAAIVPCVLIFGGGTIVNILLGTTPGWVISFAAVANYAFLPLLFGKTPLLDLMLSVPQLPRELFFSCLDGFTRTFGITQLAVDAVLRHPNPLISQNPWTMVLMAAIGGGGGGALIGMFNGFHADWQVGVPRWVSEGPAIDIWGAPVVGFAYCTLIDAHPFFRIVPQWLEKSLPGIVRLPKGYGSNVKATPLLPPAEARMACSILLAGMICTKVLLPYLGSSNAQATRSSKKAAASKQSPKALKEKKNQ